MITRESLLPLEAYARERNAFRARVIEHKKRRTVQLGGNLTLLFEDELTVADVMTPAEQVEVIAYHEVEGARVGHVLETLRRAGRQHALVVDSDEIPARGLLQAPSRRAMVRGIFSLSQLARQLGVAVQTGGEVARTFSEIESAIK